ncbi:MAG: tetratricopeptide repeat protein [bacterium]
MTAQGAPEGTAYEWYHRALELLEHGDSDASLVLLDRVLAEDPRSTSAREARARALFDSRRFDEAATAFGDLAEATPADDFAHYGLGLSLWRLQRFRVAEDHLAMAVVMRPDRDDYRAALDQVRATLRARRSAGLPPEGPPDPSSAAP